MPDSRCRGLPILSSFARGQCQNSRFEALRRFKQVTLLLGTSTMKNAIANLTPRATWRADAIATNSRKL
jgi:hypothetical protein